MHDLGEILHESEISSHSIRQTSELTQFWNEGDLDTSLAVLVDQQGLIQVIDILIILLLVVLGVRDLLAILLKSGLWRHAEVNPLDTISLLVVSDES